MQTFIRRKLARDRRLEQNHRPMTLQDSLKTKSPIMMNILRARAQHEGQELAPGAPGLSASDLVRLLEEYRMSKTEKTLDQLAVGYDIDRDQLARLVRFVDVPDEQPMPTN
ncbi:hypothetical protein MPSI1_002258 [Malassezia psittaci]|uniref:Uncharacterized protein n=1 Tax=Malassezia psittaci TaxID=1821823 RepID=A0AAF0F9Z7_9BASI|nr:hypothetical protein MPSI1_002258 [Malassezia psittaci]